jgi:hypothetical protein
MHPDLLPPRATTRRLPRALASLVLLLTLRPLAAGPLESAARLREAAALRDGPWPGEVAALHDVVRLARRADPSRPRALTRLARRLDDEGFLAASLAARAQQHEEAEPHSEAQARTLSALAHALLDDGDRTAPALLEHLVEEHGRRAPREAARAVAALVELDQHAGDERALRRRAAQADDLDLPPTTRMRALDALGRLRLAAGDRREAERLRARCGALHEEALQGTDEREARAAARLWLDLPLALALDAHPHDGQRDD